MLCSFLPELTCLYSSLGSSKYAGLVDYDDDDEDYQPPPRKHSKASKCDESLVESPKSKRKSHHMDTGLESPKKQHCEDLKSDDSVTEPSCSTISQHKLLKKEKTEAVLYSSKETRESDNKRLRSNKSILEKKKPLGCGSLGIELMKANSTCTADQFDSHGTLSKENPDGKEHCGDELDCQDGSSNNQMCAEICQERFSHDASGSISNQSSIKESEEEGHHELL